MEYRNSAFNSQGNIDSEVNHPRLGWIPCTFSPDDDETEWLFHAAKEHATAYVSHEE